MLRLMSRSRLKTFQTPAIPVFIPSFDFSFSDNSQYIGSLFF